MALPTPYPELNAVLRELVASVQAILGDTFVAACLQGSFAVGDFDRHSDVDFIIAIERELSDDQVQALQAMHKRIYSLDCGWAQHLEGSYFPREVLRHSIQRGKPLWYLDHGSQSLVRSDHCNTVVVRWVVREHGIALAGQSPATLVDPIPVKTLRQEIMATLRNWGQHILDEPERYNNRFYQTFIVLSYCRMLHDLHTGSTGSKRAGAEWAKATLDASWAGLIDRAWAGRPNPALSVRQPADPADFRSTLEFVKYVIGASMKYTVSTSIDTILESHSPEVRALVERLRQIIRATVPVASEAAHPVWHSIGYRHPDSGYFCGLFPQSHGVDLAFEFGVLLPDPDGLLEGDGKQVRYVRVRSSKDIRVRALKKLLTAAIDLPKSRDAKLAMIRSSAKLIE